MIHKLEANVRAPINKQIKQWTLSVSKIQGLHTHTKKKDGKQNHFRRQEDKVKQLVFPCRPIPFIYSYIFKEPKIDKKRKSSNFVFFYTREHRKIEYLLDKNNLYG